MATENVVRVLFEAVTNNFRNNVRNSLQSITQFGQAGNTAGRNINQGMNTATAGVGNFEKKLKSAVKLLITGFVANKIKEFAGTAINEYGKTQKALGELASLGIKDLESIRQAAIKFSDTWAGTTREEFISASYDIKSGIASLTDEGVAQFTELAALTGKATKATVGEMTTLFAQGYGIYRKQFSSDFDFGEKFSAGISKSVQQFRTTGPEMSSYLSSMGASAVSAGYDLSQVLAIGGELQATMSGSEAATKTNSFLKGANKAGEKLGLNFLNANNQLKDVPDIIDMIKQKYGEVLDAAEADELTEAFGRKEASDLIKNLYDKTEQLKNSTNGIAEAMSRGTLATEEMAQTMNTGLLEKMSILKQKTANIFEAIGEKMEPHLQKAFSSLFAKMDELKSDGTLDEIAESVGQITSVVVDKIISFLDDLPKLAENASAMFEWLSQNLSNIIELIEMAIQVWITFKIIMAIASFAKNPILTIVGILIGAMVNLYMSSETARDKFDFFFIAIKLGFLVFLEVVKKVHLAFLQFIESFTKNIPGIGDAVSLSVKKAEKSLTELQSKIDETSKKSVDLYMKINGLKTSQGEKDEAREIEDEMLLEAKKRKWGKTKATSTPTSAPSFEPTAAGMLSDDKKEKTAFEKAIDKIDDNFKSREDLIESQIQLAKDREDVEKEAEASENLINLLKEKKMAYEKIQHLAKSKDETNILNTMKNQLSSEILKTQKATKEIPSLAESQLKGIDESYEDEISLIEAKIDFADAQKDKAEKKALTFNLVDIFRDQVAQIINLIPLATSDKAKNALELAKIKGMTQIQNLLNGIKENTAELVGSFNAPSELDTLSKYGYIVQTSDNRKTQTVQNVIFNIQGDIRDEKIKVIEEKLKKLYKNVSKNEIVQYGTNDVGRN